MAGKPGENAIAYHQGSDGEIYIAKCLFFSKCSIASGLIVRNIRITCISALKSALESTRRTWSLADTA